MNMPGKGIVYRVCVCVYVCECVCVRGVSDLSTLAMRSQQSSIRVTPQPDSSRYVTHTHTRARAHTHKHGNERVLQKALAVPGMQH